MSSTDRDISSFFNTGRNGSQPVGFSRDSLAGWIGVGLAGLIGLLLARLMALNILMALFLVGALAVLLLSTNPWRGAMLLLLASQFNGFRFDYGAYTLRPDQIVFLTTAGIVFIYFLAGRFKFYRTILDLPILAFILVGLLSSALNSPDPAYSYQGLLLQTVYAGMYFLVVNIMLNYRDKLDASIKVFLYIAIAHGLYALVAFVSFQAGINIGGISSAHYGSLGLPSTTGFFQEANLFAAFIALAAILFLVHLVTSFETRLIKRNQLIFGAILLLTISASSMTRSVWVGLLIVLMVLPFYSRPFQNVINPKALAILGVIAVSLGLFVLPILNYAFSETSGKQDALYARMAELVDFSSGSGAGRLDVQDIALERWNENPFIGHGVLSYEGKHGTYDRGWFYSSIIQSLFDEGLTGAVIMLLIHLIPMVYALYAARKSSSAIRRATLVGLALGTMVLLVASQASSFFWLGFPWIYLAILVAISKATIEEERLSTKRSLVWSNV